MSTSGIYLAGRIGRTAQTGSAGYPNVTGYVNLGLAMPDLGKWNVDPSRKELNGQTARHMGFEAPDFGTSAAVVTLDFKADVEVHHAMSLPGAVFVDVRLYTTGFNALPSWQFPMLKVFGTPQSVEVDGQYQISARCKPYGPFRGPGQAEWSAANVASINLGDYASVFAT